jgi:hypothetical protein
MKLYSDEESDYICRDSRAVPLALREQVFNLIMDDDHVSLFNPLGYQKRTYHTPTNVNLYSEAVSLQMGIEPAGFINEYNKRYDVWYKAMQDREARTEKDQYSTFFNSVAERGDLVSRLQGNIRGKQYRVAAAMEEQAKQEVMASAKAERVRRAAVAVASRAVSRALSPSRTRAAGQTDQVNTPEGRSRLASQSVLGSRRASGRGIDDYRVDLYD